VNRDKPWQDRHHIFINGGKIPTNSRNMSHEDKVAAMTANLIIRNMVASAKDKL